VNSHQSLSASNFIILCNVSVSRDLLQAIIQFFNTQYQTIITLRMLFNTVWKEVPSQIRSPSEKSTQLITICSGLLTNGRNIDGEHLIAHLKFQWFNRLKAHYLEKVKIWHKHTKWIMLCRVKVKKSVLSKYCLIICGMKWLLVICRILATTDLLYGKKGH